jgi:hypothetical protein
MAISAAISTTAMAISASSTAIPIRTGGPVGGTGPHILIHQGGEVHAAHLVDFDNLDIDLLTEFETSSTLLIRSFDIFEI